MSKSHPPSAAIRAELEKLAYCGHAWEDETALGIVRSHRQQVPSFTEKCAECLNRLKSHDAAFALGAQPAREWQPIDTAPKDGTRVLVFDKSWCGGKAAFHVSYWQPYSIDSVPRGSWSGVSIATHWMPLPNPPSEAAKA